MPLRLGLQAPRPPPAVPLEKPFWARGPLLSPQAENQPGLRGLSGSCSSFAIRCELTGVGRIEFLGLSTEPDCCRCLVVCGACVGCVPDTTGCAGRAIRSADPSIGRGAGLLFSSKVPAFREGEAAAGLLACSS